MGWPSGGASSTSLLVFDRLDLVANPRRRLVVLGRHGTLQVVAELDQGRLLLGVAGGTPWDLARMPDLVVDVLQQRHQLVAEDLVIVGAPQPSRVPEFQVGDLAERAGLLVGGATNPPPAPAGTLLCRLASLRGQK